MRKRYRSFSHFDVHGMVKSIIGPSTHAKRIHSIANSALGAMSSGSLRIHKIGRGMAKELNLIDKHAIKQADRLLSNKKFDVSKLFNIWGPFLIANRKEIKIAMDWTEYNADKHATICLHLITSHGRATPLLWNTVPKKSLKNNRNRYEDELLCKLREFVPEDVKVTILADRGFCDKKLFDFLKNDLNFEYKIRIRSNISVTDQKGEQRTALQWVGKLGSMKTLRNAKITHEEYEIGTLVCTQQKGMKEAWIIACSEEGISGSEIIRWYAKRWGCEPQFRDTKDLNFGMGLSATHIKRPDRRDRLLFISALATTLLTLLGAAGEKLGWDRYLKANTSKKRTLSLFRQGRIYFDRLHKIVKEALEELLTAFTELIKEHDGLTQILGVI